MWDWFITGFCKVEFLCYAEQPNWLGWIAIGILGMFIFFAVVAIFVESFR